MALFIVISNDINRGFHEIKGIQKSEIKGIQKG